MSGWKKFKVALYCSTTLAATAVIGFALFIGATPSKINLFGKNRDIRNWVFIAAAVSLAYIILSAFTMFCILTTAKKPDLKCDPIIDNLQQKYKTTIADDSNPLLQHHDITNNPFVDSTISSQHLNNKDTDSLCSSVFGLIPSSQLQADVPNSELTDGSYAKLEKKTNNNLDWKTIITPPEHIYVGMKAFKDHTFPCNL